jgi:hypothetical protein
MPGLFTSGTSYFTRDNCTEGKRLRAQYLRMIDPSEPFPQRAFYFYLNAGRELRAYRCVGDKGDGHCDEHSTSRTNYGRFVRRAFEWSPNVY